MNGEVKGIDFHTFVIHKLLLCSYLISSRGFIMPSGKPIELKYDLLHNYVEIVFNVLHFHPTLIFFFVPVLHFVVFSVHFN